MAGYRDFIHRYAQSDDYPLLQDFIAVMREHAEDPEEPESLDRFDDFVQQWFQEVVVPQYKIHDPKVEAQGGGYVVEAEIENVGSGKMSVDIAAVRGERFPAEDEAEEAEPWRISRVSRILDAGEKVAIRIECDFEPAKLVVDPDVQVLMLKRDKAEVEL